jgi:hypothetical protein
MAASVGAVDQASQLAETNQYSGDHAAAWCPDEARRGEAMEGLEQLPPIAHWIPGVPGPATGQKPNPYPDIAHRKVSCSWRAFLPFPLLWRHISDAACAADGRRGEQPLAQLALQGASQAG